MLWQVKSYCWLIKVAHCKIRVFLLVYLCRQTWNRCRSSRGPARRANSSSAKSNQGKESYLWFFYQRFLSPESDTFYSYLTRCYSFLCSYITSVICERGLSRKLLLIDLYVLWGFFIIVWYRRSGISSRFFSSYCWLPPNSIYLTAASRVTDNRLKYPSASYNLPTVSSFQGSLNSWQLPEGHLTSVTACIL